MILERGKFAAGKVRLKIARKHYLLALLITSPVQCFYRMKPLYRKRQMRHPHSSIYRMLRISTLCRLHCTRARCNVVGAPRATACTKLQFFLWSCPCIAHDYRETIHRSWLSVLIGWEASIRGHFLLQGICNPAVPRESATSVSPATSLKSKSMSSVETAPRLSPCRAIEDSLGHCFLYHRAVKLHSSFHGSDRISYEIVGTLK